MDVAETVDQATVIVPESDRGYPVRRAYARRSTGERTGGRPFRGALPAGRRRAGEGATCLPFRAWIAAIWMARSRSVMWAVTWIPAATSISIRKSRKLTPTALRIAPPVPLDDFEVVRHFAVSKDGTKVPLNIIHRKGLALDGSHPTLLTGYGGYDISLTPNLPGAVRSAAGARRGVVEANLRGGGEYGEDWHTQGKLTKKQNVFDDFAACAKYLMEHRYTRTRQAGHHRRQQRRPADGRGVHATPGTVSRGGLDGWHLRYAARGTVAQRRVQRHGVRNSQGGGSVQGAVRLLAVPSCEGRHRSIPPFC